MEQGYNPSTNEFGKDVQSKHKKQKVTPWCNPYWTCYIQLILPSPSSREILAQDNYLYLGRCHSEITYEGPDCHCLNEQHTAIGGDFYYLNGKEVKLLPDIKVLLKQFKDKKKNGLVSYKGSIMESTRFMPLICNVFELRATFAYRRMYNYIASMHAQLLKYSTFEVTI